jgi:excinuclease ABC subunit B
MAFNKEHHITPKTIKRAVQESLHVEQEARDTVARAFAGKNANAKNGKGKGRGKDSVVAEDAAEYEYDIAEARRQMEAEMHAAADALEFERAAMIRDQLRALDKRK